jgi:WD40 repeat protein
VWYSVALLLLVPALVGRGAEKDQYGDTLPEGAKARAGTARLRINSFYLPMLSLDGKSLYAQHPAEGMVRLDPATGAVQGKVPAQYNSIPLALSADGKRALYYSFDRIHVWDTDTGKSVAKVERKLPSTDAAAISGDGKTLVIGNAPDTTKKGPLTILVWDITTDKEITRIAVPQNQSVSVAVSRDGKTVASWGSYINPDPNSALEADANPNRLVNFWNVADGKELAKFHISGYATTAVTFSPDGSVAAVSNGNSAIDLVDPKTGASKQLLLGRTGAGRGVTFSPDGSVVGSVTDNSTVQRWKVADGSRLSTTEPPGSGLHYTRVRLVDNEKGLAWAQKGSAVLVWEVPSGKLISPEGGHHSPIYSVVVTPDNKHFITSAEDGTTLKWELATGKPAGIVAFRSPYASNYHTLSTSIFNPNATHAIIRESGGIGVFDVATLTQQYVLPTHPDHYSSGVFSHDGAQIIITSNSYSTKQPVARVAVWNAATARRVASIDLPGISTVNASITPNGKYIVTANRKTTDKGGSTLLVTTWDVATGAKKGEVGDESTGYNMPFITTAPDNKTAVAITTKGELMTLDISTNKLAKLYDLSRRTAALAPHFSPDGKKLAIAFKADFTGLPATILVYEWATGKVKHTFTSLGGTPTCMAFSPDGKSLVTGSPDTTATVWDVSE